MKYLLLLLIIFLFGIDSHSQVTNISYTIENVDPNGCVKFFRIHLTTGNQPDSVRVDIEKYSYIVSYYRYIPANTSIYIDHHDRNNYYTTTIPGEEGYLIFNTSVYSYNSYSVVGTLAPVSFATTSTNTNCGTLLLSVEEHEGFQPNDMTVRKLDVPIQITSANGTQILYPYGRTYGNGVNTNLPPFFTEYIGLDVTQQYTFTVDPTYLINNNFQVNNQLINVINFNEAPLVMTDSHIAFSGWGSAHIELRCAQVCEILKIKTYLNGLLLNYNIPYEFLNNTTGIVDTIFKNTSGYYGPFNEYDFYTIKPNNLWLNNNGFLFDSSQVVTSQVNSGSINFNLVNNNNLILKINSSGNASPIIYENVPYDFIDANNVVQTIYPVNINYYIVPNGLNQNYTVRVNPQWLTNNNLTQVTQNVVVYESNVNNIVVQNFTINCISNNIINYATQTVEAFNFIAPLQNGYVIFEICNNSCSPANNATVSLTYPSILTPDTNFYYQFYSPIVNGNVFSFQINNLYSCKNYSLPFYIPGNTHDSTYLDFTLRVQDNTGLETYFGDNVYSFGCYARNSHDPNEKITNKLYYIDPDVKDTLTYTINFQNEGSLQAYKIVVRDTISPLLNLNTLKVLKSKHQMDYSVDPNTREVVFTFNNIFLAPKSVSEEDSKGYVIYSIEENDNNAIGTELKNTAYIYFDFNPPIITNTAINVNNKGLSTDKLLNQNLIIYPNPTKDVFHIQGINAGIITLIDITGKIISQAENTNEIFVENIQKGMYLMKIEFDEYTIVKQVVIE